MSVREEDRPRNCPSRGLGIAAAAIGVGVGAALYYFFNKRTENEHPDPEGSTTNWSCEEPQTLLNHLRDEDDSFFTTSEHSTSDTSVHDTSMSSDGTSFDANTSQDVNAENTSNDSDMFHSTMDGSVNHSSSQNSSSSYSGNTSRAFDVIGSLHALETSTSSHHSSASSPGSTSSDTSFEEYSGSDTDMSYRPNVNLLSPSDDDLSDRSDMGTPLNITPRRSDSLETQPDTETEWDVTTLSVDVPMVVQVSGPQVVVRFWRNIRDVRNRISPTARRQVTEEEQMDMIRDQAFRERSWSLEECSICFDVMLRNQEVMTLQCTHRFHQECIMPWLQEKQTCPNCRKAAE